MEGDSVPGLVLLLVSGLVAALQCWQLDPVAPSVVVMLAEFALLPQLRAPLRGVERPGPCWHSMPGGGQGCCCLEQRNGKHLDGPGVFPPSPSCPPFLADQSPTVKTGSWQLA